MYSPQHRRFSSQNSTQDNIFGSPSKRPTSGADLGLSYNAHGHSSPFVEGKKNSSFVHPNLKSSNVFYDYDYAYKNDLPNPRLLASVKNDRFDNEKPGNKSAVFEKSSDDQVNRRSAPWTPGAKSASTAESNDANDLYSYSPNKKGSVPNLRISGQQTDRGNRDIEPLSVVQEEPAVMSARYGKSGSCTGGKYCKDCVNSHLASQQQGKKESEKAKDAQHMKHWAVAEEKRTAYNYDVDRQQRVISAKEQNEAKSHAALNTYKRLYGKEKPEVEGGQVIETIFDKQEERSKQNQATMGDLRSYNLEKMIDGQKQKEVDRIDRLTSEHNSLQVDVGYSNKYMPPGTNVVKDLEEQMRNKEDRKFREKEAEVRLDQEINEANWRALEKEKQAKKEKAENYQRALGDQLSGRQQDREFQKEKSNVDKQKAKFFAEQCAEDQKSKQIAQAVQSKKSKEMFMESLKQHQEVSSYKKKYDQKKQVLQGTGGTLNLGSRPDLHPCNGCNTLKEKHHLSNMKI